MEIGEAFQCQGVTARDSAVANEVIEVAFRDTGGAEDAARPQLVRSDQAPDRALRHVQALGDFLDGE